MRVLRWGGVLRWGCYAGGGVTLGGGGGVLRLGMTLLFKKTQLP